MKTKKNSNVCLYFEVGKEGKCIHYGGKENVLEACFPNCKKIKNKRANANKKSNEYITGVIIE